MERKESMKGRKLWKECEERRVFKKGEFGKKECEEKIERVERKGIEER